MKLNRMHACGLHTQVTVPAMDEFELFAKNHIKPEEYCSS